MSISNKLKERLQSYGKWAVTTGASSGIGFEITSLLAEAGLNVVMIARNEERLQFISNDLRKKWSVSTRVISADVSEHGGLKLIRDATNDLDIGLVVLSAGYGSSGSFIHSSIEEEVNMLRVNCEALLVLTHHFANRFAKQHRGGIVLLSSIVAFQGAPYAAHYAATKAYVQTLAEGISIELKNQGVDVLAAAPGPVRSGFEARASMKMKSALEPNEIGIPILNALGKQTTIFPGNLSKLLITGLRTVPRWGKIKIIEKVMKGLTVK
jgi:uncharacterized protein